ncbi:XRE family transcriptional regulator [Variovorax sp. E3]|uniref:helix-turn-helix domain-containing protein n=1 Tax=Variovorax sp. E3 TaxID=1914993 RepID=UPI0027DBD6CD|nr:XRE family transcriptional regulator [Variovorax sp. E3]
MFKLPLRISSASVRPAPSQPPRSEPASLLGLQIRALRKAALTSGGELAARAGVSRSMLSRVERGLASPSVETLERIAQGLGVSISQFFAARAPREIFFHVPAGRGLPLDRALTHARIRHELLGRLRSGDLNVMPCLVCVDAPFQTPEMVRHEGLKFIYVLGGSAQYRHGARQITVSPGDALLFDANVEHGIVATQDLPLRYLYAAFSLRD